MKVIRYRWNEFDMSKDCVVHNNVLLRLRANLARTIKLCALTYDKEEDSFLENEDGTLSLFTYGYPALVMLSSSTAESLRSLGPTLAFYTEDHLVLVGDVRIDLDPTIKEMIDRGMSTEDVINFILI